MEPEEKNIGPDEDVQQFMDDHDVDEDIAERAIRLRNEMGVSDEEAIELAQERG